MPRSQRGASAARLIIFGTALAADFGGTPAKAADAAFGEYLSSECTACHRRDGENRGIPSIIGWPPDQFIAALKAYRDKERPNAIMQTIASRLTDDEMAALAAFYRELKTPQ